MYINLIVEATKTQSLKSSSCDRKIMEWQRLEVQSRLFFRRKQQNPGVELKASDRLASKNQL